MTRYTCVILSCVFFIAIPLFLFACGDTDKDDVREETEEAVETMEDFVTDKRAEYREMVESRLEKIQTDIQKLRESTSDLESEARAEVEKAIDALAANSEQFGEKLTEIKDVGEAQWEESKSKIDKELEDLEKAYHDAAKKLQTAAPGEGQPEVEEKGK